MERWSADWPTVGGENSPFGGREALGSAARVGAVGDVVQRPGIGVEGWVDKTHRAFTDCEPLLVDAVDDRGEDRRAG